STTIDEPGPLNPPIDPYAANDARSKAAVAAAANGTATVGSEPAAAHANTATASAPACGTATQQPVTRVVKFHRHVPKSDRAQSAIRMPSFEAVRDDPVLYAHASRILHLESNPGNARALVQRHGSVDVWLNPPPLPLSMKE